MSTPHRFPDRDEIAAVRAEADTLEPQATGGEHTLAGRVLGRRHMGKLVFLDDVDLGDVIGVRGHATKTKCGEPPLAVTEFQLLAKIQRPLPDTYHGVVDAETRYRKRHLDLLVNEQTRRDFLIRSEMVAAIRRFLDARGFVEVETPILQPRYGGALAEPFVTHSNELDADLYLRIADELYLKRLIVGGLEKVYEISKDFRNESISYKHQPEFTMLEWYEAYADYEDAMALIEELLGVVAREATGSTKVSFRGHE